MNVNSWSNIFDWLEWEDLVVCKQVCKTFHALGSREKYCEKICKGVCEYFNEGETWADTLRALTDAMMIKNEFSLKGDLDDIYMGKTLDLQFSSHLDNLDENIRNAIARLPSLRNLNVMFSMLEDFPSFVLALPNLRNLLIGSNRIESLPDFTGCLANLQSLDLTDNHIVFLPDSITCLSNLQELYLGNNKLEELPSSFGKLTHLNCLFLGGNRLKRLPGEISKLTNLVILDLETNQLEEFPSSLCNCDGNRGLINLQELNLGDNYFKELPYDFGSLVNLRVLALDCNPICELPKSIAKLTKLKSLNIGSTLIKKESIPKGLPRRVIHF